MFGGGGKKSQHQLISSSTEITAEIHLGLSLLGPEWKVFENPN